MEPSRVLKPVDLMVACYFAAVDQGPWTQAKVAGELGLSQSKVHQALRQLSCSGLWRQQEPVLSSLEELLVHGVRYVYPAELGPQARGIPTAHTKPVMGEQTPYVWPHEQGQHEGTALTPLHHRVPETALRHKRFHDLVATIDLLRVGRSRERSFAAGRVRELLHGNVS
jgi:hypothetical protein